MDEKPGGVESTFQLLERFRRGDREALDRLFARYLPPLQRWASGRLPRWARDAIDTQDVVQETLLQTFKRIDVFQPEREGALQAYLRQAVLNRVRDEIRRVGRKPAETVLDSGHADDQSPSPLEHAIGSEAFERYETALASLREEDREAIIARVEMGYTYEQLADALGKPSAEAARKAAERALMKLAEEMKRAE